MYLNKIKKRQIFEPQAFEQILFNANSPQNLIKILDNYICRAIAYSAPQNPSFPQGVVQSGPNVISNLNIEAKMNVYNQLARPEQTNINPSWPDRNYVKENCKSITHVRIAYFINQQITKEENRDPLEYFENYRKTNNE